MGTFHIAGFRPWTYDPSVRHIEAYLGAVPLFFPEGDDRPAAEQIDERYAHGGGWGPFGGWRLIPHTQPDHPPALKYPGDSILKPLAWMRLPTETVIMYRSAIVLVLRDDGTFDVARMD